MQYKTWDIYPKYKFYINGNVYGEKFKNRTMKIDKRHRIKLSANNITKEYIFPRILYELFTEDKLTNSDKISFKDENRIDKYHFDNLFKEDAYHPKKVKEIFIFDSSKEWKPLRNNDNYIISNYGDVYSVRLNRLLVKTLDKHGYYKVSIEKNNKYRLLFVHRLVYDVFIGLIGGKLQIDHLDRDRKNNYIGNLSECSALDNLKNRIVPDREKHEIYQLSLDNKLVNIFNSYDEVKEKLGHSIATISKACINYPLPKCGFLWKYSCIMYDTEGFVPVKTYDNWDLSKYKINKKGVILGSHNKILKYNISGGYNCITLLPNDHKTMAYSMHRLLAMTFIPNPHNYPVVNHIDKNTLNNDLDNLEWCTIHHNNVHAQGKKINQIDPKTGEIIEVFGSFIQAYEKFNKKYNNHIYRACVGKYPTAYGFKWAYA